MNPKRHIVTLLTTPQEFERILLYSMIVSHGIRVDTFLYVVDKGVIYTFSGYELRHLYPQKRSIEGFISKVLKKVTPPGVRILPSYVVQHVVDSADYYVIQCSCPSSTSPKKLVSPLNIVILAKSYLEKYKYLYSRLPAPYLCVDSRDQADFINKSHYILDLAFGAWIRRLGRIEYKEPIFP